MTERKEERNLSVVTKAWEGLSVGETDVFFDALAEDIEWFAESNYPLPGKITGKEATVTWIQEIYHLQPGIHLEVEQMFPSGDTVTLLGTTRGDGLNGYLGLPKVYQPWVQRYCVFHVLNREGKIAQLHFFYDRMTLLQQVGLMPQVSMYGLPLRDHWSAQNLPWIDREGVDVAKSEPHTVPHLALWFLESASLPLDWLRSFFLKLR